MARNAAVIRQWKILRELDARHLGMTVQQLVDATRSEDDDEHVTVRTIYRDITALQSVGFALTTDARDGHTYYRLDRSPFSRLTETGFSFSELCALYLSRRVVEALTGVPFQTALGDAFAKFEQVISPGMRGFLERLPQVVGAKPIGGKVPRTRDAQEFGNRLVQAVLERRIVEMIYFSASHNRKKRYEVHPYRMVYAQGGFYLYAFVPEYGEIRTFATHRIRSLTVGEDRFPRPESVKDDPFGASLGPGQGPPVHVVLKFDRDIAQYVKERQYHSSQKASVQPDGSLRLELDVCDDAWLRSWVLGFGHSVQVLAPPELAESIATELKLARRQYAPGSDFDEVPVSAALLDLSTQGRLPF